MKRTPWIIAGLLLVVAIIVGMTASDTEATALSAARNTPQRSGKRVRLLVAEVEKIYAGSMVMIDSSGYATSAASVASHQVVGRAATTVDNSTGTNGELKIDVEIGVFGWANFGGVTDGNIGDICYVVDDQTVSVTNSGNGIIAGVVVDVDSSYVWVDTGERDKTAGAFTTLAVSGAATFGSTVVHTGAVTMASTLNVTGAGVFSSTLGVDGNVILGGTVTISNTLSVAGASAFTGAGVFSGNLGADGTFKAGGASVFSNTLTANGAVVASSTLGVDGNTIVGGTLTASSTVSAASGFLYGATVGKSFAITNTGVTNTMVLQFQGGICTGALFNGTQR